MNLSQNSRGIDYMRALLDGKGGTKRSNLRTAPSILGSQLSRRRAAQALTSHILRGHGSKEATDLAQKPTKHKTGWRSLNMRNYRDTGYDDGTHCISLF